MPCDWPFTTTLKGHKQKLIVGPGPNAEQFWRDRLGKQKMPLLCHPGRCSHPWARAADTCCACVCECVTDGTWSDKWASSKMWSNCFSCSFSANLPVFLIPFIKISLICVLSLCAPPTLLLLCVCICMYVVCVCLFMRLCTPAQD